VTGDVRDGSAGSRFPEHEVVLDELLAAVASEPFQRFLGAIRSMPDGERGEVLEIALAGSDTERLDLGLPAGMQLTRRPFGDGTTADFALSRRAPSTGALISVFVDVSPEERGPRGFRPVPPNDPAGS